MTIITVISDILTFGICYNKGSPTSPGPALFSFDGIRSFTGTGTVTFTASETSPTVHTAATPAAPRTAVTRTLNRRQDFSFQVKSN